MTKVLYCGPMSDGTGYSNASKNTVLGLDKNDVDIYPKDIKLCNQRQPLPPRLQKLLTKKIDRPDILIQHTLPPGISYFHGPKNVGYFHVETTSFAASSWQFTLNLMDEVWVASERDKESCQNSGIKVPIKVMPIPFDLNQYQNLTPLEINGIDGRFVFYTIGDYSNRKNIKTLIKAYLSTFSIYDNVVLVLKTFVDSVSFNKSAEIIRNDIEQIKRDLRKYKKFAYYPKIILITDYLSDQQMLQLHQLGDCFVSSERGTGFNIPAFEAMAVGNQLVMNGWGGFTQFTENTAGCYHTRYAMIPVEGMAHCPYQSLYTSYEFWADPNIVDLCENMMKAYNAKINKHQLIEQRQEILNKYSLETAGKFIKENAGI